MLYYYGGEIQAYRNGDWKIKLPYKGNLALPGLKAVAAHDTLLLNLKNDMGEKNNLIQSNPAKVHELLQALENSKKKVEPAPKSLVQQMPADDSHKKKKAERSAKN